MDASLSASTSPRVYLGFVFEQCMPQIALRGLAKDGRYNHTTELSG